MNPYEYAIQQFNNTRRIMEQKAADEAKKKQATQQATQPTTAPPSSTKKSSSGSSSSKDMIKNLFGLPYSVTQKNKSESKTIVEKNDVPLTKKEMVSREIFTKIQGIKQYGLQQAALESQKQNIDTSASYKLSTGEIISGTDVIKKINEAQKSNSKSFKEYDTGIRKNIEDTMSLPEGTTFTKSYDEKIEGNKKTIVPTIIANIPESAQLEWNKYYNKKAGNLPPVASHAEQFGQGIVSDVLSLGSPIAGLLGHQKEYDIMATVAMSRGSTVNIFDTKSYMENLSGGLKAGKYGIHYINPLDVVFEPIGLSPKGSTEFLLKNPAFLAGGVGGEIGTLIAGNEAIRYIGSGVSKGIRVSAPKIIETTHNFFPGVSSELFPKLSGTTVGKNFFLWTRGYEPITKGTESILGSAFIKSGGGLERQTYLKNIFKGVPNRFYGFSEREFISPDFMKNLFKPEYSMTMAARGTGFEFTIEKTSYNKGFLGGLKRTYEELKVTSRPGSTFFESDFDFLKQGDFGSFYNLSPSKAGIPLSEREMGNPKVNWLYNMVLKEPGETGTHIFVPSDFFKDTEASASLIGRTEKQLTMPFSSEITTRGISSSGLSVSIPTLEKGSVFGSLGSYAFYRESMAGTRQQQKGLQIQMPVMEKRMNIDVIRSTAFNVDKVLNNFNMNKMGLLSIQEVKQEKVTGFDTTQMFNLDAVSLTGSSPFKFNQGTIIPFVPIPGFNISSGLFGGGGEPRRRKKGARSRTHPVRLYDALYVTRVAI